MGVVTLSAKSGAGLPELLARIERSAAPADGAGRRRPAAHPRAPSRSADRGASSPGPRARGAGNRASRRGPAAGHARARAASPARCGSTNCSTSSSATSASANRRRNPASLASRSPFVETIPNVGNFHMAKPTKRPSRKLPLPSRRPQAARRTRPPHPATDTLTTNQGMPISDNQNSLKSGARGPTLLEDFVLREKITHFDHERIPERIVHARGSAAHGYFELHARRCRSSPRPAFLQTPASAPRCSPASRPSPAARARSTRRATCAASRSSSTPRRATSTWSATTSRCSSSRTRSSSPTSIHAVKMEPDRGFPQAATAHDTFWDFISLMPESMHMVMWACRTARSRARCA